MVIESKSSMRFSTVAKGQTRATSRQLGRFEVQFVPQLGSQFVILTPNGFVQALPKSLNGADCPPVATWGPWINPGRAQQLVSLSPLLCSLARSHVVLVLLTASVDAGYFLDVPLEQQAREKRSKIPP
jgi:hypothetical protein